MAWETECPECHRLVGVVQAPDFGATPRYKIAVHASVPRTSRDKGRRPRCELGTGREVKQEAMWKTTRSPEQRKRVAREG